MRRARRVRAVEAVGQPLQPNPPFVRGPLEVAEDVLDEDHSKIHNDAEVHGPDGEEVCAFASNHKENDGKEQRERDVQPNDDRAADVAEENPLDEEDEQASEDEVVQDRVSGHCDQRGAIIIGNHRHPRRQTPIGIHLLDLGPDLWNHVGGPLRAAHYHDGAHHVVVPVPAQDAEPRHAAHIHPGNILHQHGHAARLSQDDVLDIIHLVPWVKSSSPPSSISPTPRMLIDCWPMRISRPLRR